jgi:hypothetical protein
MKRLKGFQTFKKLKGGKVKKSKDKEITVKWSESIGVH